jgi:uncharacterized protein YutE (UPF0331/DUF86 family)
VTPGRISEKVVTAKLTALREMLEGIATLPLASEQAFLADPRMVAAGESFLRRALEAILDLGRHVLAKGFGDVVPEYAHLGSALAARGVLGEEVAARVRQMGGYRNRLVHGYEAVTGAELYRILTGDLADLSIVADALRAWLVEHGDRLDRRL